MNNKWMKAVLTIMIITIAFSTIGSATTNDAGAPIQQSIKKNIDNGNLTPSIAPEFNIQVLEKDSKHLKIISKTKITFKNAKEAGYKDNIWPKFKSNETEYDQKIKDNISANIKNSNNVKLLDQWNNYNFDSGERTFVFNEIYELSYTDINKTTVNRNLPNTATTIGDILMGFTDEYASGSYSWSEDLYIWIFQVAHIDAGTSMNGAFGLRLPIKAALNTPDKMFIGQIYYPSTSLHGIDWNADNYLNANVPVENGNEFVARFDIYLWAYGWITGIGNFYWNKDIPIDESRSFQTPFGPGQYFPIPPINLPPDLTGLKLGDSLAWIGTGLLITPLLGSTDITTGWLAQGAATGQGAIDYNAPDVPYSFGPVRAGNSQGWANIKLSDYKYHFSLCQIDLGANLQIGGALLPSLGTDYYTIYDIDCSAITGGLYLGTHPFTTANNINKNILVSTPSTTSITVVSPNGGETWVRGTTHTISWSSTGTPGSYVKIELLKGGVLSRTISSSTPNDGSYSWTIPSTQTIGNDYKVRITSTSNSAYTDTSNNNFIIGGINVISPNGGETWRRSTTHTISWSSGGTPGSYVKIELLKGGVLSRTISSSTPNDGSYSWTIPSTQTTGTDYKVRITSTSNSAYKDSSNSNFIISS